jgi:hypothetical protein
MRGKDYILAVNGDPTNRMNDIYESLVNTGQAESLKLNAKVEEAGSRETVVVPSMTSARSIMVGAGNLEKSRRPRRKVGTYTFPT